ncbi:PREDICTED: butyrophilin subfamily 1 member A1-like isoform X2 [Cyprinodon variegatus]|uniref:butyrophilin subfamily 1 member A1-like isoform X2 n=1 Tax=Cyprinodon variegatus TaxID=28743 RepID=UPI00074263CC|nr:PREDICTED: butyrophilin subfamily 1 member A1-like isoform X2 [Cyprinodon variegatus]
MELLVLLSLCLLTFIGKTFGDDSIKITIKEDEDIILNCSFEKDITGHRIEWKKDYKDVFYFDFRKEDPTVEDPKFKDRVAHFSEDLKSGDASIKIKGAKVSDSGKYTCLHINQPGKAPVDQRLIELTVGTCPKPDISALEIKDGGRQVECTAVGAFPQPKMELKNDADVAFKPEVYKVFQNGSYFDIVLIAVVTEEGYYHCVLTQKDICHQIFSKRSKVLMTSEIAGHLEIVIIIAIVLAIAAVVLVIVAVGLAAALIYTCKKYNPRNNERSSTSVKSNLSEESLGMPKLLS